MSPQRGQRPLTQVIGAVRNQDAEPLRILVGILFVGFINGFQQTFGLISLHNDDLWGCLDSHGDDRQQGNDCFSDCFHLFCQVSK